MGDGLISWESDTGSRAGFAQVDGPVGLHGWERAMVDMVGPAVSCLAHVEVHQHRGAPGGTQAMLS